MRRKALAIGLLAAVAISATAFGFDAYFSDASGNKISTIWEGGRFYVVVNDPEKGACGIDKFTADLVIFDFKTGAYIQTDSVTFKEFTAGSGLYFWVDGAENKRAIKVGDRDWDGSETGFKWTHWLGSGWEALQADTGAWEYVDDGLLHDKDGDPRNADLTAGDKLPTAKETVRLDFNTLGYKGRVENMDTLVLIVADETDERNIDQDQLKIVDTVATLTVSPTTLEYGCGTVCANITVTINDPDENLDCDKIDYVPFFVIINPGSWNQTPSVTGRDFCSLKMYGGVNSDGKPIQTGGEVIRWYNIYRERYIDYSAATWLTSDFKTATNDGVLRAVFYAAETDVSSGVFTYNFGNIFDFIKALNDGLNPYSTATHRFPTGTTIAFYYLDPNDFDDFTIATAQIGTRPHSETYITDANGVPVTEVKIGHTGLYVRVYDADANVEACCQDKVVVHLCDPHNEDDSEYWVIDEVSNDSGIFASQSGMPLLPVWDAVGGYQLVFDSWTFEAFNEDTIYARYNSVVYEQKSLNALGDGNPNDGFFPPAIDTNAARNQYWDVSFDLVKVYDYQVFDGQVHHMRFLNGAYEPVAEIPVSGSLYLEVTDLDQNENPLLRELVFGGWNKDAEAGEAAVASEDSAPIWEQLGDEGDPTGSLDIMTPDGATGGVNLLLNSISGIPATVKVFIWNAQRGTWERMDLRETAVGSGVFRSTTCVLVADARHPGDGNLGSKPGDTIMAFYQDPSNHSDIAIISIKVSEGGAAGVTPPTGPSVAFDATQYNPGDTVTITVTDPSYAGVPEISGTAVLVLKDATGAVLESWDSIPAVSGTTNQFQVTYTLPEDVALGTITAIYTDPAIPTRTAEATAQVVAAELSDVTGISVSPIVFSASTTFSIVAVPEGAVADSITVTIYDLLGKKLAEVSGEDTASVTWDGESLRNGAYIYVAVVEGADKVWTFRGFVYIKR